MFNLKTTYDKNYKEAKKIFDADGRVDLIFTYSDGGKEHKVVNNINSLKGVLKFHLNLYQDEITISAAKAK